MADGNNDYEVEVTVTAMGLERPMFETLTVNVTGVNDNGGSDITTPDGGGTTAHR